MGFLGFKVVVPDTSGGMFVPATQINAIDLFITGLITLTNVSASTIYILPYTFDTPPTAQDVVDGGTPIPQNGKLEINDPARVSSHPNLAYYYCATTSGVGDLRVFG